MCGYRLNDWNTMPMWRRIALRSTPGAMMLDAVDHDMAGRRLLQPVAAAQQRALARARRADDEDELLRRDREVDALEDLDLPKRLAEAADVEDRLRLGHFMLRAAHAKALKPAQCRPRAYRRRLPPSGSYLQFIGCGVGS